MNTILKFLKKLFAGTVKKTDSKNSSKQSESSNIPKPDEKQMQERWPVPETPFMIVKLENSYFVTFMEYRLTDPVLSITDAWEQANHPGWQLHVNLINAIILHHERMKTESTKHEVTEANRNYMKNLKKHTSLLNHK